MCPPWSYLECCYGASGFNTRSRARVCWPPENMLHHKLPAEPNCPHSTRQSIHSRQLKSNFHSMRLAPGCELGERGRRATSVGPSRTPLRQSGRARTTPYAHGHSAPTAALHCDRRGSAQPGLARPSSELPAVMGSNKGLTRRSVQEGTAVEVQRPSGARWATASLAATRARLSREIEIVTRREGR